MDAAYYIDGYSDEKVSGKDNLCKNSKKFSWDWGLGIGDWVLGIGEMAIAVETLQCNVSTGLWYFASLLSPVTCPLSPVP